MQIPLPIDQKPLFSKDPEVEAIECLRSLRRVRMKRLFALFYGHNEQDFIIHPDKFTANQLEAIHFLLIQYNKNYNIDNLKNTRYDKCILKIQAQLQDPALFSEAGTQFFAKLAALMDYLHYYVKDNTVEIDALIENMMINTGD